MNSDTARAATAVSGYPLLKHPISASVAVNTSPDATEQKEWVSPSQSDPNVLADVVPSAALSPCSAQQWSSVRS